MNSSMLAPAGEKFENRLRSIERVITFLEENEALIVNLLTQHASYTASVAEVRSSIKALRGAEYEVRKYVKDQFVDVMAVFMPSNMLLYFYALYLLIPSLYAKSIFFRPSSHIADQTEELHQLLQPIHHLPIAMQSVSQRDFVMQTVRCAQLIVFTGTYQNAELIRQQIENRRQTFVYFGQGVNPAIVGKDAEISIAIQDLVSARMFNTGQDCMGPNIIFVERDYVKHFMNCLQEKLGGFVFGPRNDPAADYSPMFYGEALSEISHYLAENSQFIACGGTVDFSKRRIDPTVLLGDLAAQKKPPVVEFFGPIFSIVSYDDNAQLMRELDQSFYRHRAMGASVHGSPPLAKFLQRDHMVAVNQSLFDLEDGNQPFGGYGQMANYVFHGGRVRPAPILLSKVVGEYF